MTITIELMDKIKSILENNNNDYEISRLLYSFIDTQAKDSNFTIKNNKHYNSAIKYLIKYFEYITIENFSMDIYLSIIEKISKNKSRDIKAILNKILPILLEYIVDNTNNKLSPNINELFEYKDTLKNYCNNFLIGTPSIRKSIALEIYSSKGDKEIRRLLDGFICKEFTAPTNLNFDTVKGVEEYLYTLKGLVNLIGSYKITDITWRNYCNLIQKVYFSVTFCNIKSSNRGKFKSLLPELFKYIINNTKFNDLKNIQELNKFQDYLYVQERTKPSSNSNYDQFIFQEVYTNFPISSSPSQLHLFEYSYKSKGNIVNSSTLVNLNTDNIFIKKILIEFINTFDKTQKSTATRIENRLFIYYFDESLGSLSKNMNCIENLTFETFKKQFQFYDNKDSQFSFSNVKMIDVLKKFYIFLLSYIETNKYNHKIFIDTAINVKVLSSSNFNTMFKEGFKFIIHSPFEIPPSEDKLCIVENKSSNARATKLNSIRLDFSKIYDLNFRNDLKIFLWNKNYNYIGSMYSDFYIIKDFLNLKYEYDIQNSNITPIVRTNETFSEDFMLTYMCSIVSNYNKSKTISNTFSSVKSFVNYYKDKYKFNTLLNDYLICKQTKPSGSDGGMSIDDFNKIAEEFKKDKNTTKNGELLFIILYLCTKTKLRIGDILSLRRNCIVYIDKRNYYGTIEHYTKTEEEKVETQIPLECIESIQRAINLTEDYAKNAINKEHSKYIFITPSTYQINLDKYTIHSLSSYFYKKFYEVLNSLNLEKKYRIYDIRHMRKNEIIKAASKADKDIHEILDMIGGTIQTNLNNYINSKDIEFYVEVFTGTVISNVNVNGEVTLNPNTSLSTNVLGSCKQSACNHNDYQNTDLLKKYPFYKCLQCKDFVTTPEKIYIFEHYIEEIKTFKKNTLNYEESTICETLLQLLGVFYQKQLFMLNRNKEV
ncbi:TPA: hypothetical protein ACF2DR_002406 [Clostridium perfringens]